MGIQNRRLFRRRLFQDHPRFKLVSFLRSVGSGIVGNSIPKLQDIFLKNMNLGHLHIEEVMDIPGSSEENVGDLRLNGHDWLGEVRISMRIG